MKYYPISQPLLESAARTATVNYEQDGGDYETLTAIAVVTLDPASAALVFHIEGYDVASASWVTLLSSASVAGVGTTILQVGPDVPTVTNVSRTMPLPRRWRLRVAVADTDSMTYSVGAWLS